MNPLKQLTQFGQSVWFDYIKRSLIASGDLAKLIAEGVNINVTLLFSSEAWEKVALAYIAGLEKWAAEGGDLTKVASVASFFVSRIDSAVDGQAAARAKTAQGPEKYSLEAI